MGSLRNKQDNDLKNDLKFVDFGKTIVTGFAAFWSFVALFVAPGIYLAGGTAFEIFLGSLFSIGGLVVMSSLFLLWFWQGAITPTLKIIGNHLESNKSLDLTFICNTLKKATTEQTSIPFLRDLRRATETRFKPAYEKIALVQEQISTIQTSFQSVRELLNAENKKDIDSLVKLFSSPEFNSFRDSVQAYFAALENLCYVKLATFDLPIFGSLVLSHPIVKWAEKLFQERVHKMIEAIRQDLQRFEEILKEAKTSAEIEFVKRENELKAMLEKVEAEKKQVSELQIEAQKLQIEQTKVSEVEKYKQIEMEKKRAKTLELETKKKQLEKEKAEIEKQNTLKAYPVSSHIEVFSDSIDELEQLVIKGDEENHVFKLYMKLKEVLEQNSKIPLEKKRMMSDDVIRLNQIETLMDLYGEKIARVEQDETINEDERQIKINYWVALRDKEIQDLQAR